jgi:lipopolysaccharide transport system ATP-binding protein
VSAVKLEHVSKRFFLHRAGPVSLQDRVLGVFRPRRAEKLLASNYFWALKDVTLSVERGETVGVVGSNGAGKSTTLKLIARTIEPNAGRIIVNGRVAALLELGAGFHPDLTARENIFLHGAFHGLSRGTVRRKFDAIVEFADIGEFLDVPVRHFSSGMYVRLGFAAAVNVDAEILLVDEVLAVGDQEFQKRCLDRVRSLQQSGHTIIFVSHDLAAVNEFCTRAVWIEHGQLRLDGRPHDVVEAYLADVVAREAASKDGSKLVAAHQDLPRHDGA